MDELRRQAASLTDLWSRFPRRQRIAMTAVLVASVVGFSFVIGRSTGSDWQPVCGGREFAGKELTATQTIWRQQGLRNFIFGSVDAQRANQAVREIPPKAALRTSKTTLDPD